MYRLHSVVIKYDGDNVENKKSMIWRRADYRCDAENRVDDTVNVTDINLQPIHQLNFEQVLILLFEPRKQQVTWLQYKVEKLHRTAQLKDESIVFASEHSKHW